MVELSAEQFAQRAFDLNLLDDRQLQELWSEIGSRQVSREEIQQLLLRRELLTNYQVERMLRDERSGFFYGDYKVLYLIGTGTFARVYRACHRLTNEIVALKVLRRRHCEDPEQADRFHREGLMGASLKHPNIVPIMEVASDKNGGHWLVMKFIEGRNLREFIKIRKKFEPAEATRLMADTAAGLQYAFARGLCHRDLKMSNVLVSSKGQAMLLDFGLAAAGVKAQSDDAIAKSQNPRTIDYAGLERATGVRKDDQRSDIYFLGAIYYHMLTGKPALSETRDQIQRLSKSRFMEVVPILKVDPDIPRPLALIVTKAMELNPKARYQTPGEMHLDLKLALQKLSDPSSANDDGEAGAAAVAAPAASAAPQRTLMFVESNVQLQDVIRQRLKNSGYRVLVTADPDRALSRFTETNRAADCVIFSTGELGEGALNAFNRFADNKHTAEIPAVLLLDERHKDWQAQAKLADHRVLLAMPIKLRQFRDVLNRLVPAVAQTESEST